MKYKAAGSCASADAGRLAGGEAADTAGRGSKAYTMMDGEEDGGTRESGHHQSLRSLHPWRHEPARVSRPASRACGFHGGSSRAPTAVAKRLCARRDRVPDDTRLA